MCTGCCPHSVVFKVDISAFLDRRPHSVAWLMSGCASPRTSPTKLDQKPNNNKEFAMSFQVLAVTVTCSQAAVYCTFSICLLS